ncbi:uncharacterized protein LOC141907034 [Tubulanus polymorphus]|uniref:uncharacterized protein LOC141907034 n=1 Tax=Tubulanus polymorphus TaxID=672921 RepID=UPI003DA4C105
MAPVLLGLRATETLPKTMSGSSIVLDGQCPNCEVGVTVSINVRQQEPPSPLKRQRSAEENLPPISPGRCSLVARQKQLLSTRTDEKNCLIMDTSFGNQTNDAPGTFDNLENSRNLASIRSRIPDELRKTRVIEYPRIPYEEITDADTDIKQLRKRELLRCTMNMNRHRMDGQFSARTVHKDNTTACKKRVTFDVDVVDGMMSNLNMADDDNQRATRSKSSNDNLSRERRCEDRCNLPKPPRANADAQNRSPSKIPRRPTREMKLKRYAAKMRRRAARRADCERENRTSTEVGFLTRKRSPTESRRGDSILDGCEDTSTVGCNTTREVGHSHLPDTTKQRSPASRYGDICDIPGNENMNVERESGASNNENSDKTDGADNVNKQTDGNISKAAVIRIKRKLLRRRLIGDAQTTANPSNDDKNRPRPPADDFRPRAYSDTAALTADCAKTKSSSNDRQHRNTMTSRSRAFSKLKPLLSRRQMQALNFVANEGAGVGKIAKADTDSILDTIPASYPGIAPRLEAHPLLPISSATRRLQQLDRVQLLSEEFEL